MYKSINIQNTKRFIGYMHADSWNKRITSLIKLTSIDKQSAETRSSV